MEWIQFKIESKINTQSNPNMKDKDKDKWKCKDKDKGKCEIDNVIMVILLCIK